MHVELASTPHSRVKGTFDPASVLDGQTTLMEYLATWSLGGITIVYFELAVPLS